MTQRPVPAMRYPSRPFAAWGVPVAAGILIALVANPARAQGEPLAPFAAQKVSVLPVQFLRGDSTAPVTARNWAAVRRELDDSIGTAIAERGIGKKWAYAADIERMAKRNASYVSDPFSLGAGPLRNRSFKPGEQAPAVVVNNLRSLIALGDSRYALLPVELAFAGRGAEAHPVLRLILLDGRAGQVTWYADLAGAPGTGFGSAEIGALAQRIADLVAAR